jgi:hypothetical protein
LLTCLFVSLVQFILLLLSVVAVCLADCCHALACSVVIGSLAFVAGWLACSLFVCLKFVGFAHCCRSVCLSVVARLFAAWLSLGWLVSVAGLSSLLGRLVIIIRLLGCCWSLAGWCFCLLSVVGCVIAVVVSCHCRSVVGWLSLVVSLLPLFAGCCHSVVICLPSFPSVVAVCRFAGSLSACWLVVIAAVVSVGWLAASAGCRFARQFAVAVAHCCLPSVAWLVAACCCLLLLAS